MMHIFSSPLLWCKPMFLSNKLNWTVSTSLVIRERKRSYEKLFWLVLLVHRCLIEVHGVPKLWIHVRMLSSSVALGHRELRRSNGKLSPLIRNCSGILLTHFRFWRINSLEIAVKQCKNINVTRDILLPWVGCKGLTYFNIKLELSLENASFTFKTMH